MVKVMCDGPFRDRLAKIENVDFPHNSLAVILLSLKGSSSVAI